MFWLDTLVISALQYGSYLWSGASPHVQVFLPSPFLTSSRRRKCFTWSEMRCNLCCFKCCFARRKKWKTLSYQCCCCRRRPSNLAPRMPFFDGLIFTLPTVGLLIVSTGPMLILMPSFGLGVNQKCSSYLLSKTLSYDMERFAYIYSILVSIAHVFSKQNYSARIFVW